MSEVLALARDLEVDIGPEMDRAVLGATVEHHRKAVGSAPRDTGELAADIAMQMQGGDGVVWSDLRQGFFQEFGTSVMPPQGWNFIHTASTQRDLESRAFDAVGRVLW